MGNLLSARANRAKHIYQTEGLKSLVSQGFSFLINRVFQYRMPYRNLYLKIQCPETMESLSETDFLPTIQDFTLQGISTNQEADELVANGFEDFRNNNNIGRAREKLGKGAIAFCIFVGKEFASILWLATTEEAKRALTDIPLQVDFSNGEAFAEDIFTIPRYRRKGLHQYSRYIRYDYLRERGFHIVKSTSPRIGKRSVNKIYGKGRYIRILWWKHWKETLIAPIN